MPDPAPQGNSVPGTEVRAMFDRIALVYDAMNTVMTAGLDARWRRTAARAARLAVGDAAVDVACGSGALTRELARAVGGSGSVVGVDVSSRMLERARTRRVGDGEARPRYVHADAMDLPLADATADATTIAFGLRNMPDYGRCLAELCRVTRPGGRVVVLELATPERRLGRAVAAIWFERAVPLLGRLAGGGSAYRYLPDSVRTYPSPESVTAAMGAVGLRHVTWRRLWPGFVTLHVGERP